MRDTNVAYVSRLVDDLNRGTRTHTHATSAYTRPAPCCGGHPCRVGWRAPTTTHSPTKTRRIPCRGTTGPTPPVHLFARAVNRSILSRVSPARRILPYTLPRAIPIDHLRVPPCPTRARSDLARTGAARWRRLAAAGRLSATPMRTAPRPRDASCASSRPRRSARGAPPQPAGISNFIILGSDCNSRGLVARWASASPTQVALHEARHVP